MDQATFERRDIVENTFSGTGTSPRIPVYTYPIVYIADECIEKIADAVVRKMKGEQP